MQSWYNNNARLVAYYCQYINKWEHLLFILNLRFILIKKKIGKEHYKNKGNLITKNIHKSNIVEHVLSVYTI